jgi:hypothetical protein
VAVGEADAGSAGRVGDGLDCTPKLRHAEFR